MAKHKIFMVHGMGHHGTDWADDAIKTLKKSYANYPNLSRIDFDKRFELIPLEYNSIFQQIVTAWQENSNSIGPLADGVGNGLVDSLVGWLKTAGTVDDNFVWTHAADVLLYRLFADVRESIKVHLAEQIVNKLNTLKASDHWSIIGHSLGTAVTHDTLQMIWSGNLPSQLDTGFEPHNNQARVVAMVANVSRVLQLKPPVYDSLVRPGPAGNSNSGCLHYLNISHEFDPFTFPKMFNPLEWPTKQLFESKAYENIKPNHYHEKNIHDLAHYFKSPSVHIPLFRKLLNYPRIITKDQERQALDNFTQFDFGTQEESIELRQALEDISLGVSSKWDELKEIWNQYNALLEDIS